MLKATRQHTKVHNINLVLKTVYQQGDTSRADVARITGLTRATVSDIVSRLIEDGMLEETGIGSSAGGKPPILLSLRDNARQLIVIDLSGPEFTGAVVDLRGKLCARIDLPGRSEPGRGEALVAGLVSLVDRLKARADAPLLGIGVAVPGLTDPEAGVVRRSVSLDLTDLPLRGLLEERYSLPVYLINDSHSAALAEHTFGPLNQAPNLIVIRIAEGIGSGIILSGHLHYGDGFGAGEIGHLTVVEGGRRCSCGNYGCLETVASPRAIIQRVQELAEYEWISFSAGQGIKPSQIDWDFVRDAVRAGDETVTSLVKEAGRYVGVSIANLVSILNIHQIVLSGSYVEFGDLFLDAVSSEVRQRALPTMASETRIANSSLGPENVILGTSALILSNEVGLP